MTDLDILYEEVFGDDELDDYQMIYEEKDNSNDPKAIFICRKNALIVCIKVCLKYIKQLRSKKKMQTNILDQYEKELNNILPRAKKLKKVSNNSYNNPTIVKEMDYLVGILNKYCAIFARLIPKYELSVSINPMMVSDVIFVKNVKTFDDFATRYQLKSRQLKMGLFVTGPIASGYFNDN